MLHFVVQELNAMEDVESQIGLESSISLQSRILQEARQPDLRRGQDPAQPPTESPSQEAQQHQDPTADQQPMRAATAMMHGIPRGAASSWQGAACPPLHEHRPWAPLAMQEEVILPNPGYRVAASLWNLDIMERAHNPEPMESFLRHVSTMESPNNPSYLYDGPQPVDDTRDLRREASLENLAELQRYLEKLQFEHTTLRLWSNGIQDQIMDEFQRVHAYMMRMTEELHRACHSQTQGWLQQGQARANQPPQPPAPTQSAAPAQAPASAPSASSAIPVKSAPTTRTSTSSNPGMANAPGNALFLSDPSADRGPGTSLGVGDAFGL